MRHLFRILVFVALGLSWGISPDTSAPAKTMLVASSTVVNQRGETELDVQTRVANATEKLANDRGSDTNFSQWAFYVSLFAALVSVASLVVSWYRNRAIVVVADIEVFNVVNIWDGLGITKEAKDYEGPYFIIHLTNVGKTTAYNLKHFGILKFGDVLSSPEIDVESLEAKSGLSSVAQIPPGGTMNVTLLLESMNEFDQTTSVWLETGHYGVHAKGVVTYSSRFRKRTTCYHYLRMNEKSKHPPGLIRDGEVVIWPTGNSVS